ncbi:MAG TPA: CBS domain-containing protein [Saprospirales bacterium]|nr:CBS domain-containing protein [Saprospirales bacterium]
MMNEKISTIMTTEVITVGPEDNLDHAKQLLEEHEVEHLPVVDDGKLVGILSYYDLWEVNKEFKEYSKVKVKEIMTRKVVHLEPNDKIGTATEVLLHNLFQAIPITDSDRNLVGIVTNLDILCRSYKKEYPKHYENFKYFK